MAEDKGKEEEKFDFTLEGEGLLTLGDARMLAVRTAAESPGDYGSTYQGVAMVFEVLESGEDADYYTVTLPVRPQGNFDGTAGQEQFLIGQDGTIAVRQVLSSIVRKGGGFPILPVAIGVVVVGIIAAVGAMFLISSSGGGRTTSTPNARSYYEKGEDYYEAENWVMAIGEYTTAIQMNPDYEDAYFSRGDSYYELGQDQNAINDLTKVIQLNPNHKSAYYNRGSSYRHLEQHQLAINDYTKDIQFDPDYPAYVNRAYSYSQLGQYQNAINDYTKAIQLDPGNAVAYNSRGISYDNLGQPKLADADATMACSLDSQYC